MRKRLKQHHLTGKNYFQRKLANEKICSEKRDKTKHEDKTQRGGHPKIIFKKMRGIFSLCLSISDNRVRSSH